MWDSERKDSKQHMKQKDTIGEKAAAYFVETLIIWAITYWWLGVWFPHRPVWELVYMIGAITVFIIACNKLYARIIGLFYIITFVIQIIYWCGAIELPIVKGH